MPNWCITNYIIEGDTEDISSLKRLIDKALRRKNPVAESSFGPGWLGNLLDVLGENWKVYPCRGELKNPSIDANGLLHFETETAWSRCDCVEQVIRSRFPNVNILFIEEELGSCIFQTNDEYGKYFPDKYIVGRADDGMEYYSENGVIEAISQLAAKPIPSIEAAIAWTEEHNEIVDDLQGDDFVYIHKAEIINE